jgi:hypothetical protein
MANGRVGVWSLWLRKTRILNRRKRGNAIYRSNRYSSRSPRMSPRGRLTAAASERGRRGRYKSRARFSVFPRPAEAPSGACESGPAQLYTDGRGTPPLSVFLDGLFAAAKNRSLPTQTETAAPPRSSKKSTAGESRHTMRTDTAPNCGLNYWRLLNSARANAGINSSIGRRQNATISRRP